MKVGDLIFYLNQLSPDLKVAIDSSASEYYMGITRVEIGAIRIFDVVTQNYGPQSETVAILHATEDCPYQTP